MEYYYTGDEVKIKNANPLWNGKTGKVVRWVHDDYYIVEVDNSNNKKIYLMLNSKEFNSV